MLLRVHATFSHLHALLCTEQDAQRITLRKSNFTENLFQVNFDLEGHVIVKMMVSSWYNITQRLI